MKKILFLICCVIGFKTAVAQKDSLAFDDRSKYVYYKVVTTTSINTDVLYTRALNFFKTAYDQKVLKLASQDVKDVSMNGGGFFVVSKAGSLVKHDDGQIAYKINVQIKGNKYRYWFTDFVFTPYNRDRYGNFVPVAGQDLDMEKAAKNNPGKDTDHYLDECAKFSRQAGSKLEQYMLTEPKIKLDTVRKKVVHIDKW